MPFGGNPVFATVSRRLVRITGLTLDEQAAGTIGLAGDGGAEIELPAEFSPTPYADIDLAEAIEVSIVPLEPISSEGPHLRVNKAAGPPFRITVTNDQILQGPFQPAELEIWVRYH